MSKPVAVFPAADYSPAQCGEAVERIFALLPCTQEIGPDTKLLLKPNLVAKHPPESAVTTHPELVRAVLRACKKRGARPENIIVADSAGGVYNPAQMKALYQASGLWAVCEQEGVDAYIGCESAPQRTENGVAAAEFELLRPVLEADFIIDLPKLKTHVMTGLTAACKNLFGTIPGLKKAEWHMRYPDRERFGEMLIDLLLTVKPRMAILDGILAMEGDGPSGGSARTMGLVLGSEDLPNLDLAAALLIGLDPMLVPYLAAAQRRGLCGERFALSDLCGAPEAFAPPGDWLLPASYRNGRVGTTDFAHAKRGIPAFVRPVLALAERQLAPHPVVNRAKCIGCGKCAEICPQNTITIANGKSTIHRKKCIRCFCCHEMCPVKAIDVKQLRLFRL